MKQLLEFSVLFSSLLRLGSLYVQEATPERQKWSFSGIIGQYDKEQLRRGLQVYEEKCRACHGTKHLTSQTLTRPGGLKLTAEKVRNIASGYRFPVIQDDSQIGGRGGTPNDSFISPHPNDREARYLNDSAEPIDLSYTIRAHLHDRGLPQLLLDAFLPYTDQGINYVYTLLTGHLPTDPELKTDRCFPGGMINVLKPLTGGEVQQGPASKRTETGE